MRELPSLMFTLAEGKVSTESVRHEAYLSRSLS